MELCKHCLSKLKKTGLREDKIIQIINQLSNIPEKLSPCPNCKGEKLQFTYNSVDLSDRSVKQVKCYGCGYETPEIKGGRKAVVSYWNDIDRVD